jgi:hypothetical protein
VTVHDATADGTASLADNDYQAASGTLTFNPGELRQTLTINVGVDGKVEPNETFVVNLTNPTNATIARARGTGTILNDDFTACAPRPPVTLSAAPTDDGRLRVTVSASTNPGFGNVLQALAWARLDNATVEVVGVGSVLPGQRTSLPAGTQTALLLVGRVTPGQAATVHLVVTDACGDWSTFVGGGPNAF